MSRQKHSQNLSWWMVLQSEVYIRFPTQHLSFLQFSYLNAFKVPQILFFLVNYLKYSLVAILFIFKYTLVVLHDVAHFFFVDRWCSSHTVWFFFDVFFCYNWLSRTALLVTSLHIFLQVNQSQLGCFWAHMSWRQLIATLTTNLAWNTIWTLFSWMRKIGGTSSSKKSLCIAS